jgi:hypothetical protein
VMLKWGDLIWPRYGGMGGVPLRATVTGEGFLIKNIRHWRGVSN